jgi:RNA polymerase sigma factor (sigma-70 family)
MISLPPTPAERAPQPCADRPFGKFTQRLVRRKACRLIRCRGFSVADREDIEQELLIKVWEASRKFDPQVSCPEAFIVTVVERAAATLARAQKAVKRGRHWARHPFDTTHVDSDDGKSGADGVQHGPTVAPAREIDFDLANDLADILSDLPDELREVAAQLGDGSKRAAAKRLHISRRVLDQRISALRAHLVAAGLTEFLK